jgi:hypothetical protein
MPHSDSGPLVNQKGRLKNASSPYYCPTVAGEAACVAKFLKQSVYPKLHDHQRVMVVPGLFGEKVDDATDTALVEKFENYWAMASEDKRIVGLNPWSARPLPPRIL